ncbi:MAG: carbohydrate-binding family 9-like protein, partial [Kiritimatiellae bacterium]|nr:carbohydrate-binding family 9-like protein [Kiritimatiellia bacterium]
MRTTAENSKFLSVLNNPKSKTANQKLVGRKARAGIFALAAACLLMAWSGHAAEMFVPKAAKPPALDGKISDGEWNGAGKSGKFMILGDPANAATEQTEAFIMRDDENLYVAFRCHESRIDKMKAKVTTRNGSVWEDDDVEFFICEGENPADCRQFVVNSLGAQWDCREGKESAWRAGAFVDTNRWSVEMAIPWTYLGIQPEEGLLFRGNFCRGQKSKAENSAWPAIGSGLFADMENSVRIVFGSYNAAAMRELEGLAGKTEALGVSGELAGEKSGILKEIKGLAEEVKTGKKLTFREWRGVQKRTSDLEGKKTALEAKMISERFAGAAASNKVYLTSDVSRSGYDLPEIWGVRKILNKDFCYNITPREFWEKEEFKNEAFVRESMMRINPGSTREEFEDKFFNPQSPTYQMLKKTDRQFVLSGHDFSGPADMPTSLCRRFLAEYGHRFGGFQSEESFGHTTRERIWKAMALPFPRTRHEAFLGFKASYFAHDNRFRSWSLTYPEFRSWTSTAPATYLDHWILEMGAPYTGQEIGATGYSRELGMCFAFSRG